MGTILIINDNRVQSQINANGISTAISADGESCNYGPDSFFTPKFDRIVQAQLRLSGDSDDTVVFRNGELDLYSTFLKLVRTVPK